jgi:hypothetical protein
MTKTRRSTTKKTKINVTNTFEQGVVIEFFKILNMIKLYHWKTTSYATHKATDDLHSKLSDNVDNFIEVLLGKDSGSRIQMNHGSSISLIDSSSEDELKREMGIFKEYLVSLNDNTFMKQMSNTDLYNIRDEMLANINQFLYLLSFK